MTEYPETQLYGKMPLEATADFLNQFPPELKAMKMWAYFGEFLKQYYGEDIVLDQKIVDRLIQSYKNQNHSGYSHGVVTQAIMQYLGGTMDDEDKEYIRSLRQ